MATAVSTLNRLDGQKFITLTTFRKCGTPVSTPVTFADANGKLYVVTGKTTGKLKWIGNIPNVEFAPSDSKGKPLGDTIQAYARILAPQEWAVVKTQAKFRIPAPMLFIFNRIRNLRAGGNVYLEITIA